MLCGCAFALCALFVVLFGAKVYVKVLDDAAYNDVARTATLYVANKVRANDAAGYVSLGSLEGTPALILSRDLDGETFSTYLYYSDGELYELTASAGAPAMLSGGQPVLRLKTFAFEKTAANLLLIRVADEAGHEATISLYLRTAEVLP
jgi:hypothetical protein